MDKIAELAIMMLLNNLGGQHVSNYPVLCYQMPVDWLLAMILED